MLKNVNLECSSEEQKSFLKKCHNLCIKKKLTSLKFLIRLEQFTLVYRELLFKYYSFLFITKDYEIEILSFKKSLYNMIFFFKNHTLVKANILVELTCFDKINKLHRFNLVYILLSIKFNRRLKIYCRTNEVSSVISITSLFKNSLWLEREVWDMYGVIFTKNTDLRRILTDYGFKGHPLRRDFPLSGFVEVNFNEEVKRVSYNKIELSQEFRNYNFNTPWSTFK